MGAKNPTLIPTRWKEYLQIMQERDCAGIPIPFKRWTPEEIKKVYTTRYVQNLLAKCDPPVRKARKL